MFTNNCLKKQVTHRGLSPTLILYAFVCIFMSKMHENIKLKFLYKSLLIDQSLKLIIIKIIFLMKNTKDKSSLFEYITGHRMLQLPALSTKSISIFVLICQTNYEEKGANYQHMNQAASDYSTPNSFFDI